jgi:predicted metal-dependent enzyme (double-stranded beta helix superfamily)
MEAEMSEPYGLQDFVAEVRAVMPKQLSPGDTLKAISPGFERLLSNRSFLQQKLDGMGEYDDEICLHEDPDYRFTILARGVKRGQSHAGSPHDHGPLWALYGIYEGTARFERYEMDAGAMDSRFPGLRMVSARVAKAGDYDAIEPSNMHLPVFPAEGGTVILVVYNDRLDSVVRRGYRRDLKQPVRFQGQFPSPNNTVATL